MAAKKHDLLYLFLSMMFTLLRQKERDNGFSFSIDVKGKNIKLSVYSLLP
jgi:hypothetical protein